jgi:hypothetical protein
MVNVSEMFPVVVFGSHGNEWQSCGSKHRSQREVGGERREGGPYAAKKYCIIL